MRNLLIWPLLAAILLATPAWAQQPNKEIYYQVATIESLMQGVYDGGITCGALKEHGDIGLGTFQALDGEMVVLGGVVYQVLSDGSVHQASDVLQTPYAGVTFFDPDRQIHLDSLENVAALSEAIRQSVSDAPNMLYAVRIEATFEKVRTRSVLRQEKPYPPLTEAVKNQPEFSFEGRRGTVVGFYSPKLVQGWGVPGLHIHFLTAERDGGGHVLELSGGAMEVFLDETPLLQVELPDDKSFQEAELDGSVTDLKRVEHAAPKE